MTSLIVRMRFPHRQFQATPWDRAVNSGQVEWPPSPWRLARALLSVWHTRHPQVEPATIDRIIEALREPPLYRLPDSRAGHLRHYLPDASHRSDQSSPATTLTLAPYLTVDPSTDLLICWPESALSTGDRQVLAQLLGSMPYFGRAESRCEADLFDGTWAGEEPGVVRADVHGLQRVLCLGTADRASLEKPVFSMRKARKAIPEGAQWVSYSQESRREGGSVMPRSEEATVEAVRWSVSTSAPFRSRYGVLATEELRRRCLAVVDPESRDYSLLRGLHQGEVPTAHRHAHWFWATEADHVSDLVLYVPDRLQPQTVAAFLGRTKGKLGPTVLSNHAWSPDGYVPGALNFYGAGSLAQVTAGLDWVDGAQTWCDESTVWVSATPYLRVLHGKRNRDPLQLLRKDVERQWTHRFPDGPPAITQVDDVSAEYADRFSNYRRYRWKEQMPDRRQWAAVRITFAEPVAGPVSLGDLSHFGFGLFRPDRV